MQTMCAHVGEVVFKKHTHVLCFLFIWKAPNDLVVVVTHYPHAKAKKAVCELYITLYDLHWHPKTKRKEFAGDG